MKTQPTTKRTKQRAETLSMHLYGEISRPCQINIEERGEEATAGWITRMSKKYLITV